MRSHCIRPWTPDENPFRMDAAQHTENWSLLKQQQALCALVVFNTVQPVYSPIRLCMAADWEDSHWLSTVKKLVAAVIHRWLRAPAAKRWFLVEEIQRGKNYFHEALTLQMTKTVLASRCTGSLSIHQLEGGALASIKPCYWNGSNDSAGLIVKSLSGLHIKGKAKGKNSERLTHAQGLFVQHEWIIQHSIWCIFQANVPISLVQSCVPPMTWQVSRPTNQMWPAELFYVASRASKAALSNSFSPRATSALWLPHRATHC